MQIIQSIQNRIYEIRGERVIPDYDLAGLYEVETKILIRP
nr:ORF6N domain-containing protein [Terrimonas sp.]